jgi:hypothetical protein
MPSDSIIKRSTPASRNLRPMLTSFPGSEVPIASRPEAGVSPPAPNWMPSSGFAFSLYAWTLSTRRSQSSSGNDKKPDESSITSNL